MPGAHTAGAPEALQGDGTAVVTKNRFVELVTVNTVKRAATSGNPIYGVSLTDMTVAEQTAGNSGGKTANIVKEGSVWVEAAAAIAVDVVVMTDNVGRAITATTGLSIAGVCRRAAAAAGDLCIIELATPAKANRLFP